MGGGGGGEGEGEAGAELETQDKIIIARQVRGGLLPNSNDRRYPLRDER